MACSCKGKSAETYLVTSPSGQKYTYNTQIEAIAAATRLGGTWRAQ